MDDERQIEDDLVIHSVTLAGRLEWLVERDQDQLDAQLEVYLVQRRPKERNLTFLIREHCYLLLFAQLPDSAERQETARLAVLAFPVDHSGVVGLFVFD